MSNPQNAIAVTICVRLYSARDGATHEDCEMAVVHLLHDIELLELNGFIVLSAQEVCDD